MVATKKGDPLRGDGCSTMRDDGCCIYTINFYTLMIGSDQAFVVATSIPYENVGSNRTFLKKKKNMQGTLRCLIEYTYRISAWLRATSDVPLLGVGVSEHSIQTRELDS